MKRFSMGNRQMVPYRSGKWVLYDDVFDELAARDKKFDDMVESLRIAMCDLADHKDRTIKELVGFLDGMRQDFNNTPGYKLIGDHIGNFLAKYNK